ncbi:MAG: hypothetical protein ACO1NU_17185 [Arcticibacter sp.]
MNTINSNSNPPMRKFSIEE